MTGLIILSSIFGGVWLTTIIIAIVMYKKKDAGSSTGYDMDLVLKNQKDQNLLLNNMIMQAMKNSEVGTQNTINNLSLLQKQEFESISKRVDDLTTRN